VPDHCLGLIKQVKAFERLTITAAVAGSYSKAVAALTVHPLVRDHAKARSILDEYCEQHGAAFPALS
jgi:6-phospho-beta-glucosidase